MTQPSGAWCAVYCAGVPCRAVGDDRRYVPATPGNVLVILAPPASLGENPTKTQGTASLLLDD